MKAAKEVEHRRQPVRCGHPAALPYKAVAQRPPATRRDSGGGAEARAPIRRRRAHSHRPGLSSDKWGASCPDGGAVDGGPRRASGARASAAVGAMSFLVPTKPVQPLTPPRRGASPRTCTHPLPPRNPPLQGRRAATAADPSFPRRRESTGRGGVPPPTWPSRQRPINTPPRQPVKGGQSIEKATPPFPAGPASKVGEKSKR